MCGNTPQSKRNQKKTSMHPETWNTHHTKSLTRHATPNNAHKMHPAASKCHHQQNKGTSPPVNYELWANHSLKWFSAYFLKEQYHFVRKRKPILHCRAPLYSKARQQQVKFQLTDTVPDRRSMIHVSSSPKETTGPSYRPSKHTVPTTAELYSDRMRLGQVEAVPCCKMRPQSQCSVSDCLYVQQKLVE